MMAKSRELTHVDIFDSDIEQRLERLLHSLNGEAELSQAGAAGMEGRLLHVLCNRLRMLRDFRQHPEINDQQIVRPLFLTGGARTGSTKLHRLLAASGDFIVLRGWQAYSLSLRSGDRNEDPALRVQEAEAFGRWFSARSPHTNLIHPFEAHEPEEETLFFEHSLFAPYFITFSFTPAYLTWFMAQDQRKDYEFVKQILKYHQWQFHADDPRPRVLKTPIYQGSEPLIAELFPDAAFVTTNRDPIPRVSSGASLFKYFFAAYSDANRTQMLGVMNLDGLAMTAGQHMAARDSHPDLKFLDIGYTELTKNAVSAVEKIYAHIQQPFSDRARQAVDAWDRENRQHKAGEHAHTLEDYSLSAEIVNKKFSSYIERFSHCF
jgi:Sulfotransferase family